MPISQVEEQIQLLANKVLTTRCYDSPAPSMFIAIPTAARSWGKSVPSTDQLRFFWLCECTTLSPDKDSSSARLLRPHLYHHPVLYINSPGQFIEKYGANLLMNLWMLKHSQGRNGSTSSNVFGIDYLESALGLKKDQVELHLDTIISRLERAIPSTTFKPPTPLTHPKHVLEKYEDGDDVRISQFGSAGSTTTMLDANSLQELGQMITQPELAGTNNNTNNGDDPSEQYKYVAKDLCAQWICQSHYSERHSTFDPEDFAASVKGVGGYAPQQNILRCHLRSSADFEKLMHSKLVQSGCLIDLVLELAYTPTLKDWRMFRETVRGIRLMNLVLIGPGLAETTSAQAKPILRTLLDIQLESFSVENAHFLLRHDKELWNTDKDQTYGFHNLWLSLEVQPTSEERDSMTDAINNLVLNSPDLKSVSLLWNDEAPFGQGELLLLALAYKSYITRKPFKAALGTRMESIEVIMEMGNYHSTNLMGQSLVQASRHFMAVAGQLKTLRITAPVDLSGVFIPLNTGLRQWESCEDPDMVLFWILRKNGKLEVLLLICEARHFDLAEGMVDQIRRDILAAGGVCGLRSLFLEDKGQQAKKTFTW
ncbi:hypothetical protein BGX23_006350 [Mortierella sp. AD031]|nr:hypothetical protein BGX23_006350 [Mortierella sp. AD031]